MNRGLQDRILANNNQFISVNKLPEESVQPDKTEGSSLLNAVKNYCKHPVHLVNRLDKPVSGAVLFAKNASSMEKLSGQISDGSMEKFYLAIVENLPNKSGKISGWILHNKRKNKSYITDKRPDSKAIETEISPLASSDRYHLVMVKLATGRHHQIRAQLSTLGAPIKGDVKYGARRKNRDRSIHLHAWKIHFSHPVDGSQVQIEAPVPTGPLWDFFQKDLDQKAEG